MSHESKIHDRNDLPDYFEATFKNSENYDSLYHTFPDFDSIKFDIPSYMPDSPEAQSDWAWYYKAMSMMDYEVGSILSYLKKEKLIENTIIIYSSDHGGVLGRSKRFDYESGLRVPMIILFPPKYQHLAPKPNGSATDQLVSFVDMAPSILSLANIKKPKHMHGNAFMGIHKQAEEKEVFGFRGRMDEAYDMVRTVRNKKYRYIRNYMPHRPNGQHIEFLWKSKSLSKWSENYKNGNCTEEQKVFYEPRVTEELYDISTDPENINNLALNADFKKHLEKFRKINTKNCIDHLDAGFFAEGDLWQRAKGNNTTIKEVVEKNQDECLKAIEAAELATMSPNVTNLKSMLHSDYSAVRFWGATGCVLLGDKAKPLIKILKELAIESVDDISVTCAESLYLLDEKTWAFEVLINALKSDNIYVQLRALNVISNQNINDKKILQEIEILDKENEYIAKLSRYIIQKNRASQ